jgi:membrane dipeptidase
MIAIDGTAPLLGYPPPGQILVDPWDLYKKGGADIVFTTVSSGNLEDTLNFLAYVAKHMAKDPDTLLIKKVADAHEAKKTGKLGVVYQFQPPHALYGNLEWAWFFKQAGIGICQMTYNQKTEFGYGSGEKVDKGLTQKGRDLIKVLDEAKIIVDVAHGGVKTALDTIDAGSTIVVCSHGNARAVINSDRNFPDEVLKAVAQKGGICGVAGWPPFISNNNRPSMDDMIRMIDYMVELVGVDHVGIGMDYMLGQAGTIPDEDAKALYKQLVDQGDWSPETYPPPPWYYPEGIELPDTLYNLTGALLARGYKKEDIAKIWGGNWLRIMGQVWG